MEAIKFKKCHPDARCPERQTPGSAGLDLRSVGGPYRIEPGQRLLVPTGLALEIPEGFMGEIRSRSGLAILGGIVVFNAPGTIDSDYRGEIRVILINLSEKTYVVDPGQRIAQLVITRCVAPESINFFEVDGLSSTARGEGGFGSTGQQ